MRISDWSSDVCSSDLDANPTNIEVANCRDKTPGSSPSVRVKGNAKVLDRQNNFVAAFTSETFSVRKRYPSNEQNPFGKSITGANTPLLTITDLVGKIGRAHV